MPVYHVEHRDQVAPSSCARSNRHVHRAEDPIIPAGRVEADCVIPGAGHLLTLTHADAVNALLTETLCGLVRNSYWFMRQGRPTAD